MSANDAQNMVQIDPNKMVDIYKEKLAAETSNGVMLQAALQQSMENEQGLRQQVDALQKQVEALTPNHAPEAKASAE